MRCDDILRKGSSPCIAATAVGAISQLRQLGAFVKGFHCSLALSCAAVYLRVVVSLLSQQHIVDNPLYIRQYFY